MVVHKERSVSDVKLGTDLIASVTFRVVHIHWSFNVWKRRYHLAVPAGEGKLHFV